MNKRRTSSVILIFSTIVMSFYLFYSKQSEETIIFFPIDPTHYFEDAFTHLMSIDPEKNTYSLQWKVASTLNEPAYLRQDVSLLYKNGQLEAVLNKWQQHTQTLTQKQTLKGSENARYDAISFHYAEIHHQKNSYTSVQQMSKAHLYALTTPTFNAFQSPVSDVQKQWKLHLDQSITTKTMSALNQSLDYFQLNKEQYRVISLTDLPSTVNDFFRVFPQVKREEIIGKLWEGLYKSYLLGVRTEDGSLVKPNGSTIPQLLLSNTHREILVLFTLKDGTPVMLRQKI